MSLWMTEPMKFQGDTYYPLGTVAIPNLKPNIGGGRFIEKIGGTDPVRYDLPGSKFEGPTKTNVMISADSKWIKFPDPNQAMTADSAAQEAMPDDQVPAPIQGQ